MREIKFRVFDNQSKQMIYLDTPTTFDNGLWFQSDKHIDSFDIELMQYTGLKDCEGKEIYECDIVRAYETKFRKDNNAPKKAVIAYSAPSFSLISQMPIKALSDIYEVKVIGNIYENKELLE